MKKHVMCLFICACFTLVLSIPVFAQPAGTEMTSVEISDNNMNNMNGTRANDNVGNRMMNTFDNGANNYRTTAANDNDFDWGWLGLLGLIGLAGLRGRNRDHA
ncbi:WGxxGxxG family protein [Paenibacillus mendelii]|uniref:WGxxGxxG family protein n=1 Tax=Paenibacillus mendelii TaxID=206163 RepID=A0ABV6JC39_9BACL|nr:WGxxGxxG family protein [Paenibacillus mendelii]MCQ6562906.1 WGxxGxxG-CTERM domain-containing protein [Paenibacillus mendelii]